MKNPMLKKLLYAAFLSMFSLTLSQSSLAAEDQPVLIDTLATVSSVYAPMDFDTESNVVVIVSGEFPNGCYSWNFAQVKTIEVFVHTVEVIASVFQGPCTQALVPFIQQVKIGPLTAGVHTLNFINSDGLYLQKNITIYNSAKKH